VAAVTDPPPQPFHTSSGDSSRSGALDLGALRPATEERPSRVPTSWSDVPWRTIVGAIAVFTAFAAAIEFVFVAWRIVVLVVVAGFFAVVLAPVVRMVQRRLHLHRGMAVALTMLITFGALVCMLFLFIAPVRTQLIDVLTDLPGSVRQASRGRGPFGHLVSRLKLEKLVDDNQASLTKAAESMQRSIPDMVSTILQGLLAVITVVVMTSLMLTQSAALARSSVRLVPDRHRRAVTDVSLEAASAVSGYMIGNLVISLCAGVAALLFLLIAGVPNPVVIALWVAFADLIPLVGAALGAIVAVLASLLVSPVAGIAAIIFFAIYQQFENSVLQLVVMARTVKVNPLAVLLSVLVGVDLFGFVGALLSIPVAGALNVVVKEIWRHRSSPADQLVLVSERGVVFDRVDLEATEPVTPEN
jgi:predicted PurR-regulated permease PerM